MGPSAKQYGTYARAASKQYESVNSTMQGIGDQGGAGGVLPTTGPLVHATGTEAGAAYDASACPLRVPGNCAKSARYAPGSAGAPLVAGAASVAEGAEEEMASSSSE